jgi:acetyl esterase/lipase
MNTSRRPHLVRLAASLAFAAVLAVAPNARADDGAEKCVPDPKVEAAKIEEEITALFAAGKYAEAAEKCKAEMALVPTDNGAPYNLACALARLGKKDEALAALAKSMELGFDDFEHMKVDEDLASIRGEKQFAELVAKAVENDKKAEAGTYDPGIDVPGVKALDRAPEGGLKYRLLVPDDASAEKPKRVIVWLHPSGASMNNVIEGHSPSWLKAGFAVLVPTQKRWRGWTDAEAAKLFDKSLPDAAGVPGVDVKRPILMGFSAGGQMALLAWTKEPARFGGLVLDAAYPIDMEAYQRGEQKMIDPPSGDAATKTPVFVLVGSADPGHMAWRAMESRWKSAGVPLVVNFVPDGKHEWLLRAEMNVAFDKWLADVAAGKLPGKSETVVAPPPLPTAPGK